MNESIAEYLNEEIPELIYDDEGLNGNIFIDRFPESPDKIIVIESTGGPAGNFIYSYDMPTIRILTRGNGPNPFDAKELALKIHDKLQSIKAQTIGDTEETYIINCEAIQSDPVLIGEDDNRRIRYSQNFMLNIRSKTTNRE